MKKAAIVCHEEIAHNYAAALEAAGIRPVVTLDPAEAAACAGLLLPGGWDVDPARFGEEVAGAQGIDRELDSVQMEVLDRFVRAERPVFGICRGEQLANVYFGGSLIQHLPTAAAHMGRDHVDNVHPVQIQPGSILYGLFGPAMRANSSHHQALKAVGRGLRVTACAPDGVIEAAEHESLPILLVQFHPERMSFANVRPDADDGAALFRWFEKQL